MAEGFYFAADNPNLSEGLQTASESVFTIFLPVVNCITNFVRAKQRRISGLAYRWDHLEWTSIDGD